MKTEETEGIENRESITINDCLYYTDSFNQIAKDALSDIKIINQELTRIETSYKITSLARENRVNVLEAETNSMEKVEI